MKKFAAALLAVSLLSCTKKEEDTSQGPIVATVGMIADVTRVLVGADREVVTLMGEGTDPHAYQATKGDIDQIQEASLVLYNGLLLEGKMGSILENRREQGKPVVAVAEGLSGVKLIGGDSHADPHLWMDVSIWSQVAAKIQEAVAESSPESSERLKDYQAKLDELDRYAQVSLSSIPEKKRVLVTAHDAFSYLGQAYGIEVRGIQGISTESEAGLNKIESLVAYLVENKIPAVFVESSVPDKSVKSLVEGAARAGHQVVIGGELFSDAMGPKGTYEGTYVGMIDHNITTITRALGGEAPEEGFQGKLTH